MCDLSGMAYGVHPQGPREDQMNAEVSFSRTGVCTEYASLLLSCQRALEMWRRRRREIARPGANRKEKADELLLLQVDYAKKYSHLKKHNDTCELCRFVPGIGGGRDFASMSMLN
jgi:hypothetical protein